MRVCTGVAAATSVMFVGVMVGEVRAQEATPTASGVEETAAPKGNGTGRDVGDTGPRDNGYEAAFGYGNWGEYNGFQFLLAAPLARPTPNLRVQGYADLGYYHGHVSVTEGKTDRALRTLGVGVRVKPSWGRTYGLLGGGLYHTRYSIAMPGDIFDERLTHRTGFGAQVGLGYMTGRRSYVEFSANFLPLPGEVPERRRRTMLSLNVGTRF